VEIILYCLRAYFQSIFILIFSRVARYTTEDEDKKRRKYAAENIKPDYRFYA